MFANFVPAGYLPVLMTPEEQEEMRRLQRDNDDLGKSRDSMIPIIIVLFFLALMSVGSMLGY